MVWSQVLAKFCSTVELRVRPVWTKKATLPVVFATVTEIEPPEVGTLRVSPCTCCVQARPEVPVASIKPGRSASTHC